MMAEYLKWLTTTWDLCYAVQGGRPAIEARSTSRFNNLVRFAREHSRFYQQRYRYLPAGIIQREGLPPVTKVELMTHFDDWVTDPAVKRADVEAFIADPARVGQPYLGRYAVWTSSGTTGELGIFLHDNDALAVYDGLQTARFGHTAFTPMVFASMAPNGARYEMVAATGGHFAGVASIERLRRLNPLMAATARVFSILQPLPELVAQLNDFQPSYLATYPTAMLLLAEEQSNGRLQIKPVTLWTGGEWLCPASRAEIERVFHCQTVDEYGASEFLSIAHGCGEGWLHLNADWVILEAVDACYRPVSAGVASHTVLMTNLANRVQPFIRYDLGDSIALKPDPCRCGSPLPALRVEGRRDEILALQTPSGITVRLLPLALATVIEQEAHCHRFQLVQTGPDTLSVRLDAPKGTEERAAWRRVRHCLHEFLCSQGLPHAHIKHDPAPPQPDRVSGKCRQVISELH